MQPCSLARPATYTFLPLGAKQHSMRFLVPLLCSAASLARAAEPKVVVVPSWHGWQPGQHGDDAESAMPSRAAPPRGYLELAGGRAEQLGMARCCLADAIFLARALGRTLVMPANEGGQLRDAARATPASPEYFDPAEIRKHGGVAVISALQFQALRSTLESADIRIVYVRDLSGGTATPKAFNSAADAATFLAPFANYPVLRIFEDSATASQMCWSMCPGSRPESPADTFRLRMLQQAIRIHPRLLARQRALRHRMYGGRAYLGIQWRCAPGTKPATSPMRHSTESSALPAQRL